MAKKKTTLAAKGRYAVYQSENRQAKNQERKRARHAKRHPNDEQSAKNAKPGYKRYTPKSSNTTTPRHKYLDGAGRRLENPKFEPYIRESKSGQ